MHFRTFQQRIAIPQHKSLTNTHRSWLQCALPIKLCPYNCKTICSACHGWQSQNLWYVAVSNSSCVMEHLLLHQLFLIGYMPHACHHPRNVHCLWRQTEVRRIQSLYLLVLKTRSLSHNPRFMLHDLLYSVEPSAHVYSFTTFLAMLPQTIRKRIALAQLECLQTCISLVAKVCSCVTQRGNELSILQRCDREVVEEEVNTMQTACKHAYSQKPSADRRAQRR